GGDGGGHPGRGDGGRLLQLLPVAGDAGGGRVQAARRRVRGAAEGTRRRRRGRGGAGREREARGRGPGDWPRAGRDLKPWRSARSRGTKRTAATACSPTSTSRR